MKKFLNYLLILTLVPTLFLTSCKDDEDTTPDAPKGTFADLKAYIVSNDLDLPALLDGWVIAPKLTTVEGGIVDAEAGYTIPGYHVFDIRSEADFNKGHIKGSMNVALTDVVTKAVDFTDKPILVVCYSGQTAGRAVMALRLSGFQAKVMKFGFSYWSSAEDFDKWSEKTSDMAVGHQNWNTDATALPNNIYPTWESNSTDGAAILAERVDAMLAMPNSDWGMSGTTVLDDTPNYNIYNFWSPEHYEHFGHYKGAYQIKPISIADDMIKSFPTSDEFMVYCYTGQTSSFTTAWLHVLGYNAKSIGYGVNGLSHTALEEYTDAEGNHLKGVWHHSLDYPYEVTAK